MRSHFDSPIAHWRKADSTPQYLRDHLLGVGRLARVFSKKLQLESAGELIGLLHDLGKYSAEFQRYIGSALGLIDTDEDEYVDAGVLKGKVDHSSAGAQYVWQALSVRSLKERIAGQILALCIASHHSGLIDCISSASATFGEDTFAKRMRKSGERTHLDEAIRAANSEILSRCLELVGSGALIDSIEGVIRKVVEQNTTGAKLNRRVAQQQLGLAVRFLFSCLIDADRIDTADFEHPKMNKYRPRGEHVGWTVLAGRLEKHLDSLIPVRPIDGLRREISKHCLDAAERERGIYTLTVPTGGGKTLASLRFALHHAQLHQLDRVIYVVPFTTIIDQNAQDVRAILEPENAPADLGNIVLEHHSSVTPEQQTWREKVLCENWDAPVVYTTMVQFLESLFGAGTRGARRMHQLANSVLIFDEIQTLPIKCVHLFNNAINFLAEQCNTTVVLCTATQPLLHQVAAEKGAVRLAARHEIMPDVQKLFDDLKRVEVRDGRKAGGWTHDDIVKLAIAEMRQRNSCLVIVNTKDAAKRLYQLCAEQLREEEVFHLSTDMCPAHRKVFLGNKRDDKGNTVLRRLANGLPVLCVSTQLIEAGVDVDFGVVIRFAAGLDSIAQAAGRCNRNGRPEPGIVHIVNPNPQVERLEKLPDISAGRDKAERVLDDYAEHPDRFRRNLLGPEALTDFFRYYFFDRQAEMDYPVSARDLGHDDTLLDLLSANSQAISEYHRKNSAVPDLMLQQSFMTAAKAFKAIDAPTQGVVVPFGKQGRDLVARLHGAFDVEKEIDLLRTAQQFSVNVFPHVLEKLRTAGALKEVKPETRILSLDERYYSPQFGLATEPVSSMETLYVASDTQQH